MEAHTGEAARGHGYSPGPAVEWYDRPNEQAPLLDYQSAWFRDRSPVKVFAKSRRIGITWATAAEAVQVASTCRADGGMDVFLMSTGLETAREFIHDCAEWVRRLSPVVTEAIDDVEIQESEDWFQDDAGDKILAYRIDFASTFRIFALPSRPARLRGRQGYVIIDEAAQQDLEACRKAAGAMLIWQGRGRIAYISTYDGVDNGFYHLVEEIIAGDNPAKVHQVDIHQAIDDGLFRRICRSQSLPWSQEAEDEWLQGLRDHYREDFAEECECQARRSGGGLYSRELVTRCQVLGPSDCTIVEMRGGVSPMVMVDGVEVGTAAGQWEIDEPGAATASERAAKMGEWLDAYVSSVLASITASGFAVHAGLDYGRTGNLSTFWIGVLRRTNHRRTRLVIELEKMPWPEQDAVQDYMWSRLPNLAAGCADGQGIGNNSAERCVDRTGGKIRSVKINSGWHDPQFTALQKRLEEQSLELPRHFAPLVADLTSLRRSGKRIVAPQKISKDGRKQLRHADSAYALALFEQSVGQDGPAGKKATRPYRPLRASRRNRR